MTLTLYHHGEDAAPLGVLPNGLSETSRKATARLFNFRAEKPTHDNLNKEAGRG